MTLSPSGSVAVTLRPTAVPAAEFSATERAALAPSLNTGARLAGVTPPPPPPPPDGAVRTVTMSSPVTSYSIRSTVSLPEMASRL